MKYFIVILCIAQIAFAAPNQPNIVDQTKETITKIQQNAQNAVQQFNAKVLEVAGAPTNVDLLSRVQTGAESYAKDIKGVADQLQTQATSNKQGLDAAVKNIATQLTESASRLLGNNDPAKVTQLQSTFKNVIEQADSLNTRLAEEGSNIQSIFADALGKLYENTVSAAKSIAQQIDAAQPPKTK